MITRLILIRHAKPLSEGYAEDSLRPLSDEGRIAMREMAERLRREGFSPELIYSSPLLRALQSAEILGEVCHAPIEEEPILGVEFDGELLLTLIEKNRTIAFVGHMPTLMLFAQKLTGKPILSEGIGKGAVAILQFADQVGWGRASFEKYLIP